MTGAIVCRNGIVGHAAALIPTAPSGKIDGSFMLDSFRGRFEAPHPIGAGENGRLQSQREPIAAPAAR